MRKQIVLPVSLIEKRIFLIRDQKVMLDVHLAELYAVPTKRLKEQVRRNSERFPADFMFELSADEVHLLRSQFATSKRGRGGLQVSSVRLHRTRSSHARNRFEQQAGH